MILFSRRKTRSGHFFDPSCLVIVGEEKCSGSGDLGRLLISEDAPSPWGGEGGIHRLAETQRGSTPARLDNRWHLEPRSVFPGE